MGELKALANQKIDAEREKLCKAILGQIESLKRQHAAKGLLRSGNTVIAVVDICLSSVDSLARTIVAEYRWAIAQALVVSQSWVEELVAESSRHLLPLQEKCLAHIATEAKFAEAKSAIVQCQERLSAKVTEVSDDIALSLRTSFAERKRNLFRSIVGAIPRWITKLLSGGK